MKQLSEILKQAIGIEIDSRKIEPGYVFLAYPGETIDGRDFILEAINNGASAILCQDTAPEIVQKKLENLPQIPILIIPDLKTQAGFIAAEFYGYPSRDLTMIGVTGTNGKTSITQFIAQVLTDLGITCGIIGTIGVGLFGNLVPTINTTPDAVTLQRWLFKLKQAGAKAIAMEVSSHGLVQRRTNGIEFNIAVFTNLTHDHLDYHETMQNYGEAKKLLFLQPGLKTAIINADDEFGLQLIRELSGDLDVCAYTAKPKLNTSPTVVPDSVIASIVCEAIQENSSGLPRPIKNKGLAMTEIYADKIKLTINGITANINTPWWNGALKSQLLGRFNVSNLLAVIGVLGAMKVDLAQALPYITNLKTANGRMHTFGGNKKPLIVIDYAHTPDALEQVLLTLRECCFGTIWCVFGCGGDRDCKKRAIMGQIAEQYSDYVIITNDNPRTEDPMQIVDDIVQGLSCPWAVEIELDRGAAIAHAIDCANPGDIVLIAGKGHEDYQIIDKEKIHFSDQEVVESILAESLHNL